MRWVFLQTGRGLKVYAGDVQGPVCRSGSPLCEGCGRLGGWCCYEGAICARGGAVGRRGREIFLVVVGGGGGGSIRGWGVRGQGRVGKVLLGGEEIAAQRIGELEVGAICAGLAYDGGTARDDITVLFEMLAWANVTMISQKTWSEV